MTIIGIFYGNFFILNDTLKLSVTKWFRFCKCPPPWMFPPLDIPFLYWIEQVTFGFPYVMIRFSSMIFYRGVPSFAADCLCGVWCRGLATCLLYIGPLFKNLVWNHSEFVCLTQWRTTFSLFRLCFTHILMPHSMIYFIFVYLVFTSQIVLYFLHNTSLLSFYIDVVLTLSIIMLPRIHIEPVLVCSI